MSSAGGSRIGAADVPGIGGLDEVGAAILDQRVVMLTGELDTERASEAAAALMTLDATGDSRIELRLLSSRGSLDVALALIDVIDVLGVPVVGTALGSIAGGPVGILASTKQRRIASHGSLVLRSPDLEVAGTAADVERAVSSEGAVRTRFLETLASRVGRPFAEVASEWDRAAILEAPDAVSLGYCDEVLASSRGRPAVSGSSG